MSRGAGSSAHTELKNTMPSHSKKSQVTKPKSDTKPAVHVETAAPAAVEATTAPPAPTAGSAIFVTLPSKTMKIPATPQGFIPTNGADYLGILPRKSEIAVLATAVKELRAFTEYGQVFGRIVPPATTVAQVFTAAEQWSTTCNRLTQLNAYCRTQQGLSWRSTRALLVTMKAAFNLAVAADPSIATQNPGLTALFSVAKASARIAADHRKVNEQAKAEGKLPTHGKANKKAAKLAAAVAKANATASPTAVVATATPTTSALAVSPVLDGAAVTGSAATGGSH
jgi:hypothetical protein